MKDQTSSQSVTGIKDQAEAQQSFMHRLLKSMIFKHLENLREGYLVIREGDRKHEFGQKGDRLHADISIHNPEFYADVAFGGSVGAGTAWMNGHFSCSHPENLVRIFARNRAVLDQVDSGAGQVLQPFRRLLHALRRNTVDGSRKNISAHYDLGNEFFKLFLDRTLTYSSAIFPSESSSLEEGSIEKLDRICRKLDLKPNDRLIEIGTGWGSMAIHAARNYGCHVTTTTISEEQYQLAVERVREAGLDSRITVLKQDYRNLEGRWNKLVSVEMIEAVGHDYHETYFETISRLLTPDGRAVIQAITMPDQRYDFARKNVDFIKHYIFPGCCIPSMARMTHCIATRTDLRLSHVEDITLHYARTLKIWRESLMANWSRAKAQGYGDDFLRLWEFYLAYCEGGFSERQIGTVQLVMEKPSCGIAGV